MARDGSLKMRAFGGDAGDRDWSDALARASETIRRRAPADFAPTLVFAYFSDRWAAEAEAILAGLRDRFPGAAIVGGCGVGICANGVEYFDAPGIALLACDLERDKFAVFNGRAPMRPAWTALVHADPRTPDLGELVEAAAERTDSGYVFGGLVNGRERCIQFADGCFEGGLSGLALTREVGLVSRVTQGVAPIAPVRRVTEAEGHIVLALDGEPALGVVLRDLQTSLERPAEALARLRSTLIGLTDSEDRALGRGGRFGSDTRVRGLIGVDPQRGAVAVADEAQAGMQWTLCRREVDAARRDLVRICTEIRDEVAGSGDDGAPPGTIAAAIYVSCNGRGGPHFGSPSAELQIVRHALGDVPLAGFFAAGEIGHHHLYGYTGVLSVFVEPA